MSSKQDESLIKTLKTYGKIRKLLTSDTIGCVMQQSNYIIMSVSLSVVKQVNPTQIIVSSKQDERLIKTLKTYGKIGKLLTSDTIGCCHAAK